MKRKYKAGIVCVSASLFIILGLVNVSINTDGYLIRYLFPKDMFLVVEGGESVDICLNVAFDGKRRKIEAFTPQGGEEEYYFFLPSGIVWERIRVIDCLKSETWKCLETDFSCIDMAFENKRDASIRIKNTFLGEEKELTIHFMQAGCQPTIFVETEEKIEALLKNKDKKVQGYIHGYDESSHTLFEGEVKIKGHGNGSWDGCEKKSWRLEFDEPTSILGMDKGYKYVAVSNAVDPSYVRNKFIYDLAEDIGMQYSPHSVYSNFYFNGEYLGCYLITERIEVSENRMVVEEDKNQLTRIYNTDLQYYEYEDEKGYLLPNDVAYEENVGYLLREEVDDDRFDTVECGFITQDGSNFEIIYPEKAAKKQIRDIKSYIEKFHDAIASENETWQDFIDMDSFVKKYLIEQVSKNHDGNKRSSYYYLKNFQTDRKLYAGPVWDYDLAFGNIEVSSWLEPKGIVKLKPGLDQNEAFMSVVRQYYVSYFKPFLETEAEGRIRDYQEAIRSSVYMDEIRWGRENRFDEEVDTMISFMRIRKDFLDDVWLNGKTFYRVNFVDGETIVKTTYLEAGMKIGDADFDYDISGIETGKEFVGWYDENLEKEMKRDAEITDDMAFWAKWE